MKRLGKTELAKALKLSRPTLDSYLNRKEPIPPQPDEKKRFSVDEVSAYIAKVRDTEQENGTVTKWRAEALKLKVERERREIARESGDWIEKSVAKKTIETVMGEFVGALRLKFEDELPSRYIGRDSIECAQLNADAIDTLLLRFRQGVARLSA